MRVQLPTNIYTTSLPQTYVWMGLESGDWHDPSNWENDAVPNHPEATVIFKDVDADEATVYLSKPVVLSDLWFECKRTAYSIETSNKAAPDTGIFFSTGQQLANIVLSENNTVDQKIPAMIMHSCKKLWGPRWFIKTIPSGGLIPREPSRSKITFSGPIGSYKEAPRASLNIDGDIDVELSGTNTFIGPIDVRRGSLIVSARNSVPAGSVLSVYSPGSVVLGEGVKIELKELWIDGERQPDGLYSSAAIQPGLELPNLLGDNAVKVDSSLDVERHF